MAWRHVTEAQWEKIRGHLPSSTPRPKGGHPPVEDRRCVEGLLWILWTGAPWSELPRGYGSPTTCWRRLRAWEENGVLLELWRTFLAQLNDQDKIRWDECFVDGSFAPAKTGGPRSVPPSAARAQSGWFWSRAQGLRWEHTGTQRPRRKSGSLRRPSTRSRSGAGASPADPAKRPDRLLADRGYDSNAVRTLLVRRGIEPIIPARENNRIATHQDGRKLRRYKRRWRIERSIAWLQNFRRLVTRYEYLAVNVIALVHLACAVITLKRV